MTDQFLGLLTQMSQRHPSWRTRMKTPSHPAPRPPSPPRNRAQAPVTPAPTLSLPPSALALRTCPMSSPTPLPSTAADRQMMKRCWASSPAPRRFKGSQSSGSTPCVWGGRRQSCLKMVSFATLFLGSLGDKGCGVPGGLILTPSSLIASPVDPLPSQGWAPAGVVGLGARKPFQRQAWSLHWTTLKGSRDQSQTTPAPASLRTPLR